MNYDQEDAGRIRGLAFRFFERSRIHKKIDEALRNVTWIPCSERLPDMDGCYTVTLDGGHVVYGHKFIDGRWSIQDVIAWMPLPEPFLDIDRLYRWLFSY
jgi:hypothetical protein